MKSIQPIMFCPVRRRASADVTQPAVMGVLNVTPDSFSDGGHYACVDSAYDRAMAMVAQGASILDIGGESTRPGADSVSEQEELDRVIPVIARIASASEVLISLDSAKPQVMKEALAHGAGMLNDVTGFQDPAALAVAGAADVPVCIMHMQGTPRSMQKSPHYDDVTVEVYSYLAERLSACQAAGLSAQQIIVDPGFGFGKTLNHNLQLFANLPKFSELGVPILIGVSRKSMFEKLLGRAVDERLAGSLAMATIAVDLGVSIIRVHDVAQTCDAVKVAVAVRDHRDHREQAEIIKQ